MKGKDKPSERIRYGFARNKAEKLVERFGFTKPPVDVRNVAEKLGLRIFEDELPEGVSGLLVTSGTERAICVQGNDSVNRQRFTIAHEIGHFHLGHDFVRGEHVHVERGFFVSQRGKRASEAVDAKEIEANQFAACLLMPKAMVKEALDAPLTDEKVSALAKTFEVSEQAMTLRLNRLGFL